ncbi:MAG: TerB N-terminal domain-containing protein [Candidatus Eisenbacteria bacterium]|nr:TerB N-terminal domain-containing protein [Candidatus Eisenbacteria bacterium]
MELLVLLGVASAAWFVAMVVRESRRGNAEDDLEATPREHAVELAATGSRLAPAAPARVRKPARWIPAGISTEVQGYLLPGGLVYVGEDLQQVSGYGLEPALVDPTRPVDRAAPDRIGAGMPYWPTYDGLTPQSRAAFLEWLAGGRRVPDFGIGYVFLFFYGLERRVLLDASRSDEAKVDLPAIRQEVAELLAVYGSNRSFERYAAQLLNVLDVTLAGDRELAPPTAGRSYEMPLSLRVGLGRIIAAERPIPARWALAWLLHHPEAVLRTPSRRCAAEFQALFAARYAHEFGAGLIVKVPRSKLVASVQPASASFGGPITIAFDLPDIARLDSPLSKLRKLGEACEADLEAYSRWVGRNPDAPKTLAAVALLPAELVATHDGAEARELWRWIGDLLAGTPVGFCDGRDLLERCASLWGEKLAKAEAVLLAQLLQKGGYGLEPDVRFGGSVLAAGDHVALFQLEPDAPAAPSAGYAAATILLQLAVAVSASDGSISEHERDQLETHVEQSLALTDAERRRLSVHLAWLMRSDPRLTGLKKRLETLDAGQRALVADFVVSIAGADDRIAPAEVKTIGKIFALLGIPEEEVYARLHSVTTEGPRSEPLPVVLPGALSRGFAVPPPPAPRSGLALDMDAVAAKIAQSASVAAVLSEIFTDDAASSAPIPQADSTSPSGLSPAYTALLVALIQRNTWSRDEFEGLAGQHQLLPDAAVEVLNDAAFERCGSALIEGDDPLELDLSVAKECLA